MQSAEEPVQDQPSRALSSLDVREPITGPAAALIQWSLSATETAGPEAFAAAVAARAELACMREGVRLLVFPEMSGLWLLLAELAGRPPVPEAGEMPAPRRAILRLVGDILASMLRRPRGLLCLPARGFAGLLDAREWQRQLEQWVRPFREAARRHHIHICPGSSLLPPFRREPGGRLRLIGRGLANTSCLIAPNGRILGFRRKLHLTPLERRAGIAAGSPERDLQPFDTALGRIGIAVCLDGFYPDIVEALDTRGCRYLLQPSANSIDWNAELARRADQLRGGDGSSLPVVRKKKGFYYVLQRDEWLRCGAGALIQGAENLRAVYNPMCVTRGRILRHSGRSTAWVNRHLVEAERSPEGSAPELRGRRGVSELPGVIAAAGDAYGEAVLYAPLP